MVFDYCPKCGKILDKKEIGDEGFVPFCRICDKVYFPFSYPCVLCLALDENNNIILTKRREHSNYGVVAGFVKPGEPIETTAAREILEETGLLTSDIRYLKSYYYAQDDRLMLGILCKCNNSELKISRELYSAEWHPINEAINLLRQGSISQQLLAYYLSNQ